MRHCQLFTLAFLLSILTACSIGSFPLFDQDGDGIPAGKDCDDNNPAVGAAYIDLDNDGYAAPGADPLGACTSTSFATKLGDCNDADPEIAPNQLEICNDIDEDCDGFVDESLTVYTFYDDKDGDTYGDPITQASGCSLPPGVSQNGGDCDDGAVSINPQATERCDGVDNNCNGQIDEGLGTNIYAPDNDFDNYGDSSPGAQVTGCQAPPGYVQNATDCNDGENTINPGASEFCDDIDEDCDGFVDENPLDGEELYVDNDGDGWGQNGIPKEACDDSEGYVTQSGDCNDNQPGAYPGALERCNTGDDDCDGKVDEGFADSDGSGVVDCAEVAVVISQGFYDEGQGASDCGGLSNVEAEIDRLESYLEELGLSPVLRYAFGQGLLVSELDIYPLVIYDGGGWNDPPTRQTIDTLITLRDQGTNLIFIGDDLGLQALNYDLDNQDRRFFELLYLSSFAGTGIYGRGTEVSILGHPVTNGLYGAVTDFDYERDLDNVTAAGRGEEVLMTISGGESPAVIAAEDDDLDQRTLVILPGIYAAANYCPVSNGAGLGELKSLFKNGVSWSLGL